MVEDYSVPRFGNWLLRFGVAFRCLRGEGEVLFKPRVQYVKG